MPSAYFLSLSRFYTFPKFTVFIFILLYPLHAISQAKLTDTPGDKVQLEAFIDGLISGQLCAYHIAGAAISIVSNGKVLLAKGYGYSDLSDNVRVQADTTMFRIGGISQLVTTIAVMQLIEQHKVALDSNVNKYINFFKIPDTYKNPITISDILTQTTGFEEQFNLYSRHRSETFNKYLKLHIPERVRAPNKLAGYSNYGMGLAGYIVEQASNMSFDSYVREHIFVPLKMYSSTFAQPLPKSLNRHLSNAYIYHNGVFEKGEFSFMKIPPAGAMTSTASDISHLMITFLQNGIYDSTRIMSVNSAQQIKNRHFVHDPEVSGTTYGFWEQYINNQRIICHSGGTYLYHSIMALLPDYNLGIFVVYNSKEGKKACGELIHAFMDRYFSLSKQNRTATRKDSEKLHYRYLGNYRPTQMAYSTIGKLLQLTRTVSIHSTQKGNLLIHGFRGGTSQWKEIKPMVFQDMSSRRRLVFQTNSDGVITTAFLSNSPVFAYIKISWYESPEFQVTLMFICLMIFLSFIIFWPLSRNHQHEYEFVHIVRNVKVQNFTFQIALWISLLNILIIIGLYAIFSSPVTMIYDIPSELKILLFLPVISLILTIAGIILMLISWKDLFWDVRSRIHFSMVIMAAAIFIPLLAYWNVIGFHY